MGFDPTQYKTTTRSQWEDAAEAWYRWGPVLEDWLAEATDRMLAGAGVVPGARVVDVAAGAGGQSLAAARRAGAGGAVLATDLSPTILTYAAKAAAEAGVTNLDTLEADGETLAGVPDAAFDSVISRLGLIYLPDQASGLAAARRVLRDGGRFSAVVYSTPDRNQFFSVPVAVIRDRAQLPPPQPGQPGPFSLGAEGVLASAFTAAGFRDVTVGALDAPVRLASAAECVRFERESFGALHQMMAALPDGEKAQVWRDIEVRLAEYETPDGFVGPCELLVVSGVK